MTAEPRVVSLFDVEDVEQMPKVRDMAASQGTGIGGHHSYRMGTDTWLTTPRYILDALGEFDLDPCAAPDTAIWPTAKRHITLPDDGLTARWTGRVWCNPPYGAMTWKWLARCAEHKRATALLFARTETAGFVTEVWHKAFGILFLHGRLYFHHADGSRAAANAGGPSCLVAYGPVDAEILQACKLNGTYITLETSQKAVSA